MEAKDLIKKLQEYSPDMEIVVWGGIEDGFYKDLELYEYKDPDTGRIMYVEISEKL